MIVDSLMRPSDVKSAHEHGFSHCFRFLFFHHRTNKLPLVCEKEWCSINCIRMLYADSFGKMCVAHWISHALGFNGMVFNIHMFYVMCCVRTNAFYCLLATKLTSNLNIRYKNDWSAATAVERREQQRSFDAYTNKYILSANIFSFIAFL